MRKPNSPASRSSAPLAMLLPFFLLASGAEAQQIPDRYSLDLLLGPHQTLENFESYAIASSSAELMNTDLLHDASLVNGQGPGLVAADAAYLDPSAPSTFGPMLSWNGSGYFNITTRTILSGSPELDILFSPPVQAVGFDLKNFATYGYTGSATFVSPFGVVVGTVNFSLGGGNGEETFVGFRHDLGIGAVWLVDDVHVWSPILDDVGYGMVTSPGYPYCFGDGSGATCPCSNFGNTEEGCGNTTGVTGASLRAFGTTTFSTDTLAFTVSGLPGAKPCLIVRGTNEIAIPAGDGILCTTGGTMRSHVQSTHSGGETIFSHFNGGGFSSVAQLGFPTKFQLWYRDPTNPCTGSGFNFSNAWSVTYTP